MSAVVFNGSTVKALMPGLQLGTNAIIYSGNVDPSAVATPGAAGDVYISTSTKKMYQKQDSGSSTNWTLLAAEGSAITALTGDVTASGPGSVAATVNSVGGSTASNVHAAELLANAATNLNTVSTIVKRDSSGNFTAGAITAALTGNVTGNVSGTSATFTGSLTGDVTSTAMATTVAKIQSTTVSGTTGSTNVVFSTSPTITNATLVTPALGTPTSGVATNITGLPLTSGVTGTLPVGNGGTSLATTPTDGQLLIGKTSSNNYVLGTLSAGTGVSITNGSGSITVTNSLANTTDIAETSFAAANNTSVAADVSSLSFANATVRAAKILLSVYVNATSSLYEAFDMLAIQKGSSWNLSQTSVGDASGFVFTITNAGQIQYTNSNYSGFTAATLKFRAITTSI